MKPTNLLFILSDQHTRAVSGCYSHPVVQTPNLDRLAEHGTRFNNAYTNCPICVPARASLATGLYVHQIGNWDNGFPYDGGVPSWGHRLREQGHRVDSIGKLHFRGQGDDNGFSREIDPLHVVEGVGDILGCLRDSPPFRHKRGGIIGAGPGDSTYLRYDVSNADQACRWLTEYGHGGKPWVLFLSFVCPHPPYIAPETLYQRYPLDQVPLPPQWRAEDWPTHPAIDYFRRFFHWSEPFDEADIRKLTAAYYGVCTHLDQQIGRVLSVLEEQGQADATRIIYTTDHGESLGARGLFGKFTMYEESAAIPFIMAGPDIPQGKVVNTPVSLVDCFPTILEAVGASFTPEDHGLPGQSLWSIAQEPDRERTVFSEYHAVGSRNAVYMLRNAKYKYIYYVDDPPQLFDLEADPDELTDLSTSAHHQSVVADFEQQLRAMLDPETVDARAKADQRAKVIAFGGEEAVRKRGTFDNSPVPGEAPAFRRHG
jgi:choline-sulfatase